MVWGKLVLTRPSLQSNVGAAGRCVRVAACDFARNTVDACGGIRASSRDCAYTTPVVRLPDCLGRQDRSGASRTATAAVAHADTRVPRNNIAVELDGAAETPYRMLHIAYSP